MNESPNATSVAPNCGLDDGGGTGGGGQLVSGSRSGNGSVWIVLLKKLMALNPNWVPSSAGAQVAGSIGSSVTGSGQSPVVVQSSGGGESVTVQTIVPSSLTVMSHCLAGGFWPSVQD